MPVNKMLESDNNQPQETEVAKTPDPFDPKQLRLSQDFSATLGVKKAILTIPRRRPSKETWVRVHPKEEYRIQTGILELKEEQELYLVAADLWPVLATEATFGPRVLFTAITRQGVLSLWPIRLPGQCGRVDFWNRSALDAALLAENRWIRMAPNMGLGAYLDDLGGGTHARNRCTHLGWWHTCLGLETLADLEDILPRVEEALRQLQALGGSGKTLANYLYYDVSTLT